MSKKAKIYLMMAIFSGMFSIVSFIITPDNLFIKIVFLAMFGMDAYLFVETP